MLRRYLVLAVLALAGPALAQEKKAEKKFPEPGSNIPGTFSCYNVTGQFKSRFHCLVTEHDINPVVMVVVRGSEVTPALKSLLTALDAAVDRNPTTRLASFVVFVPSDLKDVARDDDKREALETSLRKAYEEAKLKYLTFALEAGKNLDKWELPQSADIIVVLYKEYRTAAFHPTSKDKLNAEKVKEVLGDVAMKLGATRLPD